MKKVLASVLAGSMVLGMAAMASAATTLTLKDGKGDYKYQLYLYQPDEFVETSGSEYLWDEGTAEAFSDFQREYNKFVKMAEKPADMLKYFENAENYGGETVVDKFLAFHTYLSSDSHAKVTDLLEAGGKLANLKTGFPASLTAQDAETLAIEDLVGSDGYTTITTAYDGTTAAKTWNVAASRALSRMFYINHATPGSRVDARPETIQKAIPKDNGGYFGNGEYVFDNKASVDIVDEKGHYMYTYGEDDAKEVKFEIVVKHGEDFRVDVGSGKVTVSKKRVEADTKSDIDRYLVTIKAAAGVRDFELDDWKVELDLHDANRVYYIEGEVAYSDYREVLPDDRYIINKSNTDKLHNDGCIFDFSEVIDEETRIVCSDYVDLLFKGNYGTDFENLRVMTDDIKEVEDFFQDYDIDYYDFIGTPKFAKDITVRIDADSDAYIYEYDKKTGDVVDITDECEYTSDGMTFKRKSLKTYVVLEEPYEGGNVKAEKEPVSEEPEDTDEPETETPDDKDATGSKPNPGTGAYPLF